LGEKIMAISLQVSAGNDYTLRFTINNHSKAPVFISKVELSQVEVCSPKITTDVQCRLLKFYLEKKLTEHFRQLPNQGGQLLEVKPARPYSFSVSLSEELEDHPFFDEQPHCFTITIKIATKKQVSSIEVVLNLKNWYPCFSVVQPGKNKINPFIENPPPPSPPKGGGSPEKLIMLEYRDTEPFYLNVAEPSTLRLWITGENQNTLINHADSKPTLNATPQVELVNTQMNPKVCQRLAQQFQFNNVKLSKTDRDTLMILPIENPKAKLKQDRSATLKITLTPSIITVTPSTENELAPLTCEIPVLLQRPAFPGHVALDFGTTNSAVAYYDPNAGIPDFPDRRFSDSQLDKLNSVIHELMHNVERQALTEPRYQDATQQLVQFARMMWTTDPQGNQVQSIADIKKHFERLQHRDVDKTQIGDWQAKLLVSWGVIGYHRLKLNRVPLAVLNFVAEQYFNALNRIIDIDLEKDAKVGLPELEPGQRDGTIPSDIMMQKLSALGETEDQYPKVEGLHSEIDMGEAVKANLATQANSVTELPNLPEEGKEKHKLYLSGAKRGLGLKETSYFIDAQNQVFVDTYDPLCTAAVKELFIRTEQNLNERRNCLNNVVVTYPANLPQYRRESYQKLLQSLGVAHIDMSFDEATAGALYYVWRELFQDLFAGIDGFLARSRVRQRQSQHQVTGQSRQVDFYYQNILLYDLGGGTTDIALLEIGLEEIEGLLPPSQRNGGRYFIIRPKILGLTGREDFGGDNVTLAVFRILKSKLASTAAQLLSDKLKTEGRRNEYPPTVQEALEAFELGQQQSKKDIFTEWFAEVGDKNYAKKVAISEAVEGIPAKKRDLPDLIEALVTTRFESNPESQSHFFGLWQEAERIKKVLSTLPVGYQDIQLPDTVTASPAKLLPAIAHLNLEIGEMELGNISVTASEMERLVRKDIKLTFEKARNLCVTGNKESGYTTEHLIDRLVLAGSGSHLRLVREEMPREVLSQSFTFQKGGKDYNLSAPFKPDGYNLEFTPEDAKLAVVRGASLPRYFKTTRIPPQDAQMTRLLTEGVNFLDFDVDNLRNYMPFTLIYAVGNTTDTLFESGAQMLEISRTAQAAIRKSVSAGELLNCYQVDNAAQLGNAADEQYYAQFPIRDAFIQFWHNSTSEKLDKDRDQTQLDKLMKDYFFWAEFDIERNLKCFMYTKPLKEGNDDQNYVNQTATVIDAQRLREAITALVDDRQKGQLKPDIALWCPVGMGGQQEKVELQTVPNTNNTVVEGTVSFRQPNDKDGGITRFALLQNSPSLWQIDLQNYQVKNHQADSLVQPKLYIQLELTEEQVQLKYTVFDPDLTGGNVQEIEMTYDSRKAKPPFNPYRGEE
jgi:hypothetical protein